MPTSTLLSRMIPSRVSPTSVFYIKLGCISTRQIYQRRHYAILGHAFIKPKQYTKYRITTDFNPNSDFEDIYISEPSRDDLIKINKDEPIFLRFLKLVTDQEKRPHAFKEFAKRCAVGLDVEKDVYITKPELLECLWENGYSELELNAYEIAFPNDYKFHYPELAVLFGVSEEDCYKFAFRKRAAKPDDLIEIKHKPTPNKIASYGVLTTAAWFGLQNNILGNIWMFVKTWPFFAVFYMLGSHFQKSILNKIHSESTTQALVSDQNRLEGEDHIYNQMKKYANDSLCLDYIEAFKPSMVSQFQEFKKAALLQLKDQMIEGMTRHLVAVQQAERAIESSLQHVIVKETVTSFHDIFQESEDMKIAAFDAAIAAIENKSDGLDPVGVFFKDSFRQLTTDTSKTTEQHPVVQRVNGVFGEQEQEFLDHYYVTKTEASKLNQLGQDIKKTVGLDKKTGLLQLENLDTQKLNEVQNLYKLIMKRVGLDSLPIVPMAANQLHSNDQDCHPFLKKINDMTHEINERLRFMQLQSFLKSFA